MQEHERFVAGIAADLAAAKTRIAAIKAAPARTVESVLEPYNEMLMLLGGAAARCELVAEVHPDAAMRDAAEASVKEAAKIDRDRLLDGELCTAIAGVPVEGEDPDTRRFVEHTLRDFRRAGVDRDEATRARLRELSDQMVEHGLAFDKNIREDVRRIQVDPSELEGLPPDYIAAHPAGPDGKVEITTDYPDYLPFRTYVEVGGRAAAAVSRLPEPRLSGERGGLPQAPHRAARDGADPRLRRLGRLRHRGQDDPLGGERGGVHRAHRRARRPAGARRLRRAGRAQAEGRPGRDRRRRRRAAVLRGARQARAPRLRRALGAPVLRVRADARRSPRDHLAPLRRVVPQGRRRDGLAPGRRRLRRPARRRRARADLSRSASAPEQVQARRAVRIAAGRRRPAAPGGGARLQLPATEGPARSRRCMESRPRS